MIDTGTYCASVAVPVILKAFLQGHGNPVVTSILAQHGMAMLEKGSNGGVLIHVRSKEDAMELIGQEVMLLGRKFPIKRLSPFLNKFFLDISGIHSAKVANDLFLGFCSRGTRPLFFTPRDVNLDAEVATPTWCYYFASEMAPPLLRVDGFVVNQVVCGDRFYAAHG